jgi:Domain of unknown function (DUF1707)
MRVSDAERDAAAAELREHFASGRLNQQELETRLSGIFAARTRGDLNAFFTDLPSAGHAQAGAGGPAFGGPFGPGPFAARAAGWGPWAPTGTADGRREWQERNDAWRAGLGRRLGRVAFTAFLVWALFILGILGVFGVFGIGSGRPIGIVLILAAFALVRRLLLIIFGRGRRGPRGGRGRGPRRRR